MNSITRIAFTRRSSRRVSSGLNAGAEEAEEDEEDEGEGDEEDEEDEEEEGEDESKAPGPTSPADPPRAVERAPTMPATVGSFVFRLSMFDASCFVSAPSTRVRMLVPCARRHRDQQESAVDFDPGLLISRPKPTPLSTERPSHLEEDEGRDDVHDEAVRHRVRRLSLRVDLRDEDEPGPGCIVLDTHRPAQRPRPPTSRRSSSRHTPVGDVA